MNALVFAKLGAIYLIVALGWLAGRRGWLGADGEASRILGAAAIYLFVPALLMRTTARIDLSALPGRTLLAFFAPLVALMVAIYFVQRARQGPAGPPALPGTRAITACFGNSVQVGIPLAAALFGEAGLAIHISVVSLHALVLLSVLTTLTELDLARAHAGAGGLARTLAATVRNTLAHPIVLPVLAGMAWNLSGAPWPALLDETFGLLGSAVSPLCLMLIGLSLADTGLGPAWRPALAGTAIKLLLLPALVLVVARYVFGLHGLPLNVLVMMAALPTGSNALIFAQRYRTAEAEAAAATVISTFAFGVTAPGWVAVMAALSG